MERLRNNSRNPKEIVRIVSSDTHCLNCRRILKSKIVVWTNEDTYQDCPCRYRNFFRPVEDNMWEVCLVKIKQKEPKSKGKRTEQLKLQF